MSVIEMKVPDIGDFKEVEVIEVLVKAGDTVKPEQSLITVESDKASMEIPASAAGVVKEMRVKVGDKVSEGAVLLMPRQALPGRPRPLPLPLPRLPPLRRRRRPRPLRPLPAARRAPRPRRRRPPAIRCRPTCATTPIS